jgi:hypothetical protein
MGFEIRKAQRKKAKLRLGLSGPSGSGKTLGALLLAYGLVKATHPNLSDADIWEKIGLIDTEEGSGEQYQGATPKGHGVKIGDYLYGRLSPPFSPERYIEAIHALERAGAEIIITDSLSHAWAGTGGVLDMKDHYAAKDGNSYTAWKNVTPEHNRLVDSILRSSSHVICTLRAKTEHVQEKDDKGKTVIRKVGMAPIQRDGMEYEFTVVLDVGMDHYCSSSKDRTGIFDGQFVQLGPDVGESLYDWLENGVEAPEPLRKETYEEIVANTKPLGWIKTNTPGHLTAAGVTNHDKATWTEEDGQKILAYQRLGLEQLAQESADEAQTDVAHD